VNARAPSRLKPAAAAALQTARERAAYSLDAVLVEPARQPRARARGLRLDIHGHREFQRKDIRFRRAASRSELNHVQPPLLPLPATTTETQHHRRITGTAFAAAAKLPRIPPREKCGQSALPHATALDGRVALCDASTRTQRNERGAMAAILTDRCCGTLVELSRAPGRGGRRWST
jgi:hypothetical protein